MEQPECKPSLDAHKGPHTLWGQLRKLQHRRLVGPGEVQVGLRKGVNFLLLHFQDFFRML